jgi:exonuclease SbcD
MGRERLLEQAQALDEIADVCEREQIELVLIAGDVFDVYTPSADAEELFFKKIRKIVGEDRVALIISGNHDDGVRLSAAAPLAEGLGIYIVGNSRAPLPLSSERKIRPTASGKGYAILENERGEKAFISTLPYPNEARFKEEKSELPYVEQMQQWIAEGESGNVDKLPSIFMAHIFVAGGKVSDSEREIDLGGARAIPIDALPKSDYVALGHLHKKQHMGKGHAYYSGSLLQYSFDESADKGVKVFDLTTNGVENLQDVPLTKGRKLIRLEESSPARAVQLLQQYPNELVELKLNLTEPLTSADNALLSACENLASLICEVQATSEIEFESRKGFSDKKLFEEFYRSQYGELPKEELTSLFLSVLTEEE